MAGDIPGGNTRDADWIVRIVDLEPDDIHRLQTASDVVENKICVIHQFVMGRLVLGRRIINGLKTRGEAAV